jgi:Bacterial Ig-like domain (group 2)
MRSLLFGFLALIFASPSFANWGVVQQTASTWVQSTSTSVSFPAPVTAGDMILVHVIWATNAGATVSDTLGNTYASAALAQGSTSAFGITYQISSQVFYAANVGGGVNTVTVTTPVSTFLNFYIYEISGAAASNPLDVTATNTGTGLSVSTSPVATTAPNDLVFVAIGHHFASDSTAPGFTGLITTLTGISEYQIPSFSGAAVSASETLTDTPSYLPWAVALAAFKINPASSSGGTPTLTSIQVTPFSPTLSIGQSASLAAIGNYSDGSTQNLTNSVTWSSASPTIASVNSSGQATAVGHGTTTITATSGTISGSTPLTVEGTLNSIQVTPASDSILAGTAQQFTATGTFTDGTTENLTNSVSWSSSNTGIATIGASGMATGITAGSATITATSGGVTGSTSLAVTQPTFVTSSPSGYPLVQTNYQWFTSHLAGNPPTSGMSACSPAPCVAQTFLNANTAGNMIFVWLSWNSGMTLSSLSDTAGNTYVHLGQFPSSLGGVGANDDFWAAYNVNAGANNKVTALFSGTAQPVYLQALEYAGVATSNAFDTSSYWRGKLSCAVAPCTMSTKPTTTITQASELLVAIFDFATKGQLITGNGWAPDASCVYCFGWDGNVSGQVLIEHQLVSTIGSYTGTVIDVNNTWPNFDGYLFTFKLHQ